MGPPDKRQVIELAFFKGLTQSEIVGQTGIPLGTVKTRTLLAMKKLRAALQAEMKDLL
ncbi:MAG: sigma factor-like helix-turn-helix DNA-binding protein [Acidobacteriota bacterium]|nr:sigma factor-like helix-turn-helix DNA-binding protein [Acidobacteriota bacterium]